MDEFIRTFDTFRTSPDFKVQQLSNVFDESVRANINSVVSELQESDLLKYEMESFGRHLVRDIEYFSELQESIVDIVSEAVHEDVEPVYNFLALYKYSGKCKVHMDAPKAKWTLDFCIGQSKPWPIHVSHVVPWPENWRPTGADWHQSIVNTASTQFDSFTMEDGESIIFSGSSQWHYRNQMKFSSTDDFCNLLFFHFTPKGQGHLLDPRLWGEILNMPGLTKLFS